MLGTRACRSLLLLAATQLRYCADCAFNTSDANAHYSSWQLGRPLALFAYASSQRHCSASLGPLRVGRAFAPAFEYYLSQSLVVSASWPLGGPIAGGTTVTLTGVLLCWPILLPSAVWLAAGIGPRRLASRGTLFVAPRPCSRSRRLRYRYAALRAARPPPEPTMGISSVDGRWLRCLWCTSCACVPPVADARAAVMCCENDGSACQSMCVCV